MNKRTLVLGAIGLYLLNKWATFSKALQFSFGKYRVQFAANDPTNTYLLVDMELTNPTQTQLSIRGFQGEALINKSTIGRFSSTSSFIIQPLGSVSVPVNIQGYNVAAIANIYQAVVNKAIPPVTLRGTVGTSIGDIPFTRTLTQGLVL